MTINKEKTAFILYLIVLIASPIFFGAVHAYAYTLMSFGTLLGAFLLIIKDIKKNPATNAYQFQLPNSSLNFVFIAILIFLIFQTISLPEFVLKFLSPTSYALGKKTLSVDNSNNWFSIAAYCHPVRMSIIRFSVYGLFFFGLINVLNSKKRIELIIFIILLLGCFEAIYGIIMTFSGYEHILWYKKTAYRHDVTGTYVNRNHFAGLMEMGLLLAACYSAALASRKKKRKKISSGKKSFKNKLLEYLPKEQHFNKRFFVLFSGSIMGVGLILSASRGGMIAAAGAMLFVSIIFLFKKKHKKKGYILLALFLITAVYALSIGVDYQLGRFKYFSKSFEVRSRYVQKTIDIFSDYKMAGVGVGNFQYIYPKYQAAEDRHVFIKYAHNDWAQLLAEAGIVGSCLFLFGMAYYFCKTTKLWRKRRDPFAVGLGIAPMATIMAIAIHSYSDFNLHIPANFLMLTAIMAIGYSAIHLSRHSGKEKSLCKHHIIPLNFRGICILFIVFGFIICNVFWSARHFIAEAYCNTVKNSTMNREQNPSLENIKRAILWDGSNAEYWYKLARELRRIKNINRRKLSCISDSQKLIYDENRRQERMKIINAFEKVVELNPFNTWCHLRLGQEYSYLWRESDYYKKWLPAADVSMNRAAYFTGVINANQHVELGNYWTMRSATIYPSDPKRASAWATANHHYKVAQSLKRGRELKKMQKKMLDYVKIFYPDDETAQQAILVP